MIVADFSYNGKLKIKRKEKMLKSTQSTIKRKFYVFTEEIAFIYPNDFYRVKLHQEKTASLISKCIAFLENMKIDISIVTYL